MKDRIVDIETADGRMPTFVTHPDGGGPFPAVVFYLDAPGFREELCDFARRVGSVGYYCMVPDLYYRFGTIRLRVGMRDAKSQAIKDAVRPSNGEVMSDTRALLNFMGGGEPVRPGGKGCIGHCMGGAYSICAAGMYPDQFRAAASLYGTRVVSDKEDSPHLLAAKFQGEIYAGYAEHDPGIPAKNVEVFKQALAKSTVRHLVEVHPGTHHGYQFPERGVYHKVAAERSWERIFAMFHRQIPAYT